MRKFLLTALLMAFMTAECFAAKVIDTDRAALGGITIGSKVDYVRSIYGDPDNIRELDDGTVEWYYGDTFQMRFIDGRAMFVCSSGPNGLNTPDDVGVGMKGKRAKKVFGRPTEKLKFDKRQVYIYDGAGDWQMLIVLYDGWIKEIRLVADDK